MVYIETLLICCSCKPKTYFMFQVVCGTTDSSTDSSRKWMIHVFKSKIFPILKSCWSPLQVVERTLVLLWWKPNGWCFFQGALRKRLKSAWWYTCQTDTGMGLLILAWLIILLIGQPVGPQCKVRSVFTLTAHTDDVWLRRITLYQHTERL